MSSSAGGGGGGGGATYKLPPEISYDDPLYSKYIIRDLSGYSGGKAGYSGSRYPVFSASNPVWYGGGNGGGGQDGYGNPGNGTPGSPGGILIEKGVFHHQQNEALALAHRNALDVTGTMLELNRLAQEQTGLLLQ